MSKDPIFDPLQHIDIGIYCYRSDVPVQFDDIVTILFDINPDDPVRLPDFEESILIEGFSPPFENISFVYLPDTDQLFRRIEFLDTKHTPEIEKIWIKFRTLTHTNLCEGKNRDPLELPDGMTPPWNSSASLLNSNPRVYGFIVDDNYGWNRFSGEASSIRYHETCRNRLSQRIAEWISVVNPITYLSQHQYIEQNVSQNAISDCMVRLMAVKRSEPFNVFFPGWIHQIVQSQNHLDDFRTELFEFNSKRKQLTCSTSQAKKPSIVTSKRSKRNADEKTLDERAFKAFALHIAHPELTQSEIAERLGMSKKDQGKISRWIKKAKDHQGISVKRTEASQRKQKPIEPQKIDYIPREDRGGSRTFYNETGS